MTTTIDGFQAREGYAVSVTQVWAHEGLESGSVFGVVRGHKATALTNDPSRARLTGWSWLGTLAEDGVVTLAPQWQGAASSLSVCWKAPYYELLTARTRSLTGGALRDKRVGFVGVGASMHLVASCVRSGVGAVTLWDMDVVDEPNLGRTAYSLRDVGLPKVEAAAAHLLQINPTLTFDLHDGDVLALAEELFRAQLAECDVVVIGTDNQEVQRATARLAYEEGVTAVLVGFYARAAGGEVVVVEPPGPCYECQMRTRFEGDDQGVAVAGEPGMGFDCDHLDTIVGSLVNAALLRDTQPRAARLFDHARQHSLIISKHDPDFTLEGQDIFGEFLGDRLGGHVFTFQTLWFNPTPWRRPECPCCGAPRNAPD